MTIIRITAKNLIYPGFLVKDIYYIQVELHYLITL